ncbi:MAG: type II secretion system F family protein [Chitinispirillaceae bacterium]|nr:type II secretion system F family protein [Chitinispirillaceae bacterium]
MPQYQYQGINFNGNRISGAIEASSEDDAKSLLRKERIRITAIKKKNEVSFHNFFGGVRLKDLSAFTRQFASMNSSAIPLVRSLDAIAEQAENKTLQNVVRQISIDVQSGVSLAEALSRHPKMFNRLYCAMVKAGEAAGILSDILLRLADYQEKTVAVRNRIRGAFAYPALVALVAVGALIALMTFVVPTFSSMLHELGAELPLSTRIVIGASAIIKTWIFPILGLTVGLVFSIIYLYQKNDKVRIIIDALSLRFPLSGNLQKKSAVSRFSRTFGALLNGGVPIAEALEITSNTAGNRMLEVSFHKALEAIKSGQTLAQPLKETGVFPAMVIQMVDVGEKSGNLSEMLVKVADYYDTEVDTAVTALTSILEPALIVVMGVIIAGVLIAMYLPMFEMVSSIG